MTIFFFKMMPLNMPLMALKIDSFRRLWQNMDCRSI